MQTAGPDALIELAYAAAIDDTLWPTWSQRMLETFRSTLAMFWVIDAEKQEMVRNHFVTDWIDPADILAEYPEMVAFDPQFPKVCLNDASEVYRDIDHVDLDDPGSAMFTRWMEGRWRARHHLAICTNLPAGMRAGLSMHQSIERGLPDDQDMALVQAIFPQVRRAIRLGVNHAEALKLSYWEGVQDGSQKPVILLDERGRIARLSSAAELILSDADGLTVVDRQLRAADSDNDTRLQAIMRAAVSRQHPASGATRVNRRSGDPGYLVGAYPIARVKRHLAAYEAAALVTIADPAVSGLLTAAQRLASASGLTPREIEIVDLLAAGESTGSIPDLLNMTRNTLRVHLRNIFAKTGVRSQSELMRILAAI